MGLLRLALRRPDGRRKTPETLPNGGELLGRFYTLDQHGDAVEGKLRNKIGPKRHQYVIGEIEGRERCKRKSRGAVEDNQIEVYAEVPHEPLHAAPHLHRYGIRIQILFRMLQ